METSLLSGLVVVQPVLTKPPNEGISRPLTAPPKTVSRTHIGSAQRGSFDLEILPVRDDEKPDNASSNHGDDLEMSQPDRPDPNAETVEVVTTIWEPFMNRFRLLSTCLSQINNALSDGATGALIPYMEKYVNNLAAIRQKLMFLGTMTLAMPLYLSFSSVKPLDSLQRQYS
jgi:hypothetical protein